MPEAPLSPGQGNPPAGVLHSPPGASQPLPSEESGGFTAVTHGVPVERVLESVRVDGNHPQTTGR